MYASLDADMEALGQLPGRWWKVLLYVFLPSLIAFVAVDIAFISLVAKNIYHHTLKTALRDTPDPLSGVLAWLCIVGAVWYFVVPLSRSPQTALARGAVMGVVLYGTYEMTNLSILTIWTWGLAVVDTTWGAFACGMLSTGQWWLMQRLLNSAQLSLGRR